jgi:hypothetical protein
MKTNRFVGALAIALSVPSFGGVVGCSSVSEPSEEAQADELAASTDVAGLLTMVPDGKAWADLSPKLRLAFQKRAKKTLATFRHNWGLGGLRAKLGTVRTAPTTKMRENINRLLSLRMHAYAPDGFDLDRDVTNPDLRAGLLAQYIYDTTWLSYTNERSAYAGWDGEKLKEMFLADAQVFRDRILFADAAIAALKAIPDAALTPSERAFRTQSMLVLKTSHSNTEVTAALWTYTGMAEEYGQPLALRAFATDAELLEQLNAWTFVEFGELDEGATVAFTSGFDGEFEPGLLKGAGVPDAQVKPMMTLGGFYRDRFIANPKTATKCTPYSSARRAALWDGFTGDLRANADGLETMDSYAARYLAPVPDLGIAVRLHTKRLVNALFPDGDPLLTTSQRATVIARIDATPGPIALYGAAVVTILNEVTGGVDAGKRYNDAVSGSNNQIGGYADGEALRAADLATVNAMWDEVKAYLAQKYRGYPLDIASLLSRPILSATYAGAFTTVAGVTIGLKEPTSKPHMYEAILHEAKHSIDFASRAAVEGAAWEGAAKTTETSNAPEFLDTRFQNDAEREVYAFKASMASFSSHVKLGAKLQVYTRSVCNPADPSSFEQTVSYLVPYGYDDALARKRLGQVYSRGLQPLSYDYGVEMYSDIMAYLQTGIGTIAKVDAFLLQACKMPSPTKSTLWVDKLRTCVQARTP